MHCTEVLAHGGALSCMLARSSFVFAKMLFEAPKDSVGLILFSKCMNLTPSTCANNFAKRHAQYLCVSWTTAPNHRRLRLVSRQLLHVRMTTRAA